MVSSGRIWVCGTGTEIGKTHIACALCRELRQRGAAVAGRKPVESGYDDDNERSTDAYLLASASGVPFAAPVYRFCDPVSPHLAARRAGTEIELDHIERWLSQRDELREPPHQVADGSLHRSLQLVETAGGLLSPLAPAVSNLDMVARLCPAVLILVAPDRLGVLHDVAVSLLALETRQLRDRAIVVLSAPALPDTATGTNADELVTLGIAEAVITFPRAPLDGPATHRAAAELADATLARFT